MWDLTLYFKEEHVVEKSSALLVMFFLHLPALGMTTAQSEACSTPGRATRAASPQKGCSCPGLFSRWPWAPGTAFCWWKVTPVILCFGVLGMN